MDLTQKSEICTENAINVTKISKSTRVGIKNWIEILSNFKIMLK